MEIFKKIALFLIFFILFFLSIYALRDMNKQKKAIREEAFFHVYDYNKTKKDQTSEEEVERKELLKLINRPDIDLSAKEDLLQIIDHGDSTGSSDGISKEDYEQRQLELLNIIR